jgi:hypothetical protein
MIERLFRGFKAGIKGELVLWIIILDVSGVIYLVTSLRL